MPHSTEEEKQEVEKKKRAEEDEIYTKIVTELESGNCSLFIGPEIRCLLNAEQESISVLDAFSNFIASEAETQYEVNNFYYRANKFIKQKYEQRHFLFDNEIQNFVAKYLNNIPDLFNQLVKLPFNAFISMCPDEFVSRALIENGYDFAEDYYDFSIQESHDTKLTGDMRLVYYINGKFSQASSVPVTEMAQLQLVKNLVAEEPSIPVPIRKRLSDTKKSFLFLGANFNDWQFRIILDALTIPKPALSIAHRIPNDREVAFLTKEFYSEAFGFNFVEKDIKSFLKELTKKYEERNGDINRRKKVVLDYHERDNEKYSECMLQLSLNGISNRVDFFEIDKVPAGSQREEKLAQLMQSADIYIPFLSSYFLQDNRERLITALQSSTQVIVIHAGAVGISSIPLISKAQVLPNRDVALSSIKPENLNSYCLEIAKTINAIIR